MIICAFDTETTGVNPTIDRITEIGAVVFKHGTDNRNTPLGKYNALVYDEGQPEQTEEIVEITGITNEMLKDEGIALTIALSNLTTLFNEIGWPDAFLAHNAPFDKRMLHSAINRLDLLHDDTRKLMEIPFVCSLSDIKYSKRQRCKQLSHLALDMGIMVDPTKLHRASDDCELLVELVTKMQVDFRALLQYSEQPDIIIRAVVPIPFGRSGDGGKGKDAAKAAGFNWQTPNGTDLVFTNMWVKKIKMSDLPAEKEKFSGYEIAIIETQANKASAS